MTNDHSSQFEEYVRSSSEESSGLLELSSEDYFLGGYDTPSSSLLQANKENVKKDKDKEEEEEAKIKWLQNHLLDKGIAYFNKEKFSKSKKYFIELYNYEIGLSIRNPGVCHNIGVCYYRMKQYEGALHWYSVTLKMIFSQARNNVDVRQLVSTLESMSYVYRDTENYAKMKGYVYLSKALKTSSKTKNSSQISMYKISIFNRLFHYLKSNHPLDYQ